MHTELWLSHSFLPIWPSFNQAMPKLSGKVKVRYLHVVCKRCVNLKCAKNVHKFYTGRKKIYTKICTFLCTFFAHNFAHFLHIILHIFYTFLCTYLNIGTYIGINIGTYKGTYRYLHRCTKMCKKCAPKCAKWCVKNVQKYLHKFLHRFCTFFTPAHFALWFAPQTTWRDRKKHSSHQDGPRQ